MAGTFGSENGGEVSLKVPALDLGKRLSRFWTVGSTQPGLSPFSLQSCAGKGPKTRQRLSVRAVLRGKTAVFTTKTVAVVGAAGPAAGLFSGGEETDGGLVARWGVLQVGKVGKMSLFADLRHGSGFDMIVLWQFDISLTQHITAL